MKIIQINSVYNYASTGRTTYEIHNWLLKNHHQSYVFYGEKSLTKDEGVYPIGNKIDHKFHSLMSRLTGLQGYFSHVATWQLLKKIDSIKPDIVIIRILHSNYINVPMLLHFLSKKNIATVAVLHDCWLYTGHCAYYSDVCCSKWKKDCKKCPHLHNSVSNDTWFANTSTKVFKDRIRDFGSIRRLGVVGVSEWVSHEACQSPIFSKASIIKRIYNWIDLDKFRPINNNSKRTEIGLREDEFVILGVASGWISHKGLDKFIEIAKKMPKYRIVLVGKMVANKELPNNILAVGRTNSVKELAEYYNMADVFISPSRQETFGKVIAEALACGTPCIVNNATAMPELVSDGCGYTVNDNNVEEFCEKIKIIRSNGKKFYTDSCLKKAHNNFDKERNISEYMKLFNDLQN